MNLESLTPVSSFAGGVLIGVAATAMLALLGRVAGVSGIVGGLLALEGADAGWRAAFVAGLVGGGLVLSGAHPAAFAMTLDRSVPAVLAAGLLVGFGTRLGSGCTSGHGVCGIARGSKRSITATLVFLASGIATAAVITQLLGGRL
jgi:uncharacterized membrane protein YedE/YeeE